MSPEIHSDNHTLSFGEYLRELRIAIGLSQSTLAKKSGVDPSHISRIERGLRNPPKRETLVMISHILELDDEETAKFFGTAGYSAPKPPSNTDKNTESNTKFFPDIEDELMNLIKNLTKKAFETIKNPKSSKIDKDKARIFLQNQLPILIGLFQDIESSE